MASRPAEKRSGPRRDRSEGKAAIVSGGGKTTVESTGDNAPSGWNLEALKAYLHQVKLEMGRVSWPSRRELQAATMVVMMTLLIFSAYLGVFDWVLRHILK